MTQIRKAFFFALISLAVTACGGGEKLVAEMSSSLSDNSTFPSDLTSSRDLPSVPSSMNDDYLAYERQLLDIKEVYGNRPVALNSSALWYKSLSYPSTALVTKESRIFSVDSPMEHGVGYGTYYNIDSSRTLIFYTFWAP